MVKSVQLELGGQPYQSHGLFSDHYLGVLGANPDWQARRAAAEPARQAVRAIFAGYQPSANEAQTENDLIRPVLLALGHLFEVQAPLKTPEGTKTPDYVFYRNEAALNANKGHVLTDALLRQGAYAVGDAKYWDRNLDQTAKGSGDALSNKNPTYQIYYYMLHSGLDWGILTNGHQWRLYHRSSAHKLDQYYQVDLPALLALDDADAWLYFWAFFSREAFMPGPLSAATILQESADYAQAVSADLKRQVYEALRHLAQGFLDYPSNHLAPEPGTLKEIYDASLILLYRILFILYAEDRGLLPIWESVDYRESYSLRGIKLQVARALDGGRKLLATSAKLWPDLQALFHIINAGSPPLKVTTYNGGLFDPAKHPFLERYEVGDAHLQQAIDMLARVDGQLVDYRDLSERHLGSIYEGLLEYHLVPIAPEAAATRAWDGAWQVALENDRGERHSTGSYYTPDFVVKYITDRALGPVLRERTAGLDDDAAIAQAVLAVNVADPAMGSGHFLVEATEYIARFLVERGVRVPSGLAAEDEPELTAWKRRVVHSCIYGVDLNPLAVELAKLSLWLATVAKDRPLSFLDHHLRCGNSLVGSWIAELGPAADAPAGQAKAATGRSKKPVPAQSAEGEVQLSMLGNAAFTQALGSAVDAMWTIEDMPGETVAQVKSQEQIYGQLREELNRHYGRLADVMTAERLGGLHLKLDAAQWRLFVDFVAGRSLAVLPQFQEWLAQAEQLDAQDRFFHWELEFPEVWFDRDGRSKGAAAGFDAVIGNPPYIRQEQLTPFKPYFGQVFSEVAAGTADLSVYFIGQGMRLLRQDGLLCYITSRSWLNARYATALRAYLRTQVTVAEVIDLGDAQIFADAREARPSILTLQRAEPATEHTALGTVFTRAEGFLPFDVRVHEKLSPVAIHNQDDDGWRLGGVEERAVFNKLMTSGEPFGTLLGGRIYLGVKTGLNSAFVISEQEKNAIIARDPAAARFLRRLHRGEDVRPWYQENSGHWIVVIPCGWSSTNFGSGLEEAEAWEHLERTSPGIASHLRPFAEAARHRTDKGDFWWELRACDYYDVFQRTKIVWPEIAKFPRFSINSNGTYINNKTFMADCADYHVLGVLQSRAAWYCITNLCVSLGERAGTSFYQHERQFISRLPIPPMDSDAREAIQTLAEAMSNLAETRCLLDDRTRHRIQQDLGAPGKTLNSKLATWWDLDFAGLRSEVKKVFRKDIPR